MTTTSTERVRRWREKNPERYRAQRREWNRRYRERQKDREAALAAIESTTNTETK